MNLAKNFVVLIILLSASCQLYAQNQPVKIAVDMSREIGDMKPIWAFFGYDEPNYTYMKDGRKLLTEISDLSPVPVYIRTHNLLTSGDGTARLKWGSTNVYTEDENGNPVYDWKIVDKILDTYVERGLRPLVELGFMPKALSLKPENYEHYWGVEQKYDNIFTGWTTPPSDYEKWGELIYQLVNHCIEKYGREEVETWLWEPWNEPNIGYWSGTLEEYCKLYDYSAHAIKKACDECTVGGPHSTGPGWDKAYDFLIGFLQHCVKGKNYVTGETGSTIEYIGYHAKGQPKMFDDHIRMNMATQLNDIAKGFEAVRSFPELKDLPIIIGECDPEGCAACSESVNPQNGYRNGTMYSSYTASSFAKIYEMMDDYGVNLKGALSWAFEFENQPWFDGFRDLATNGVDKPVLNVFRMYGMMGGKRVSATSNSSIAFNEVIKNGVHGKEPDIGALASKDGNTLSVMIWNYHDDDLPAAPSPIELEIEGFEKGKVLMHHYRIDKEHSNSFEVWKSMGKPQDVSPEQFEQLEDAGQLELLTSPEWVETEDGKLLVKFTLPRQGVSLVRFEW